MSWFYISDKLEQVPVDEQQIPQFVANGVIQPQTMVWTDGMENWAACAEIKPELFVAAPAPDPAGAQPVRRQLISAATVQMAGAAAPAAAAPAQQATIADPAAAFAEFEGRVVRDIATQIAFRSGWMKFLGVLMMIGGAISALAGLAFMVSSLFIDSPGIVLSLVGGGFYVAIGVLQIWLGTLLFGGASRADNAHVTGSRHTLNDSLEKISKFFMIMGILALCYLIMVIGAVIVISLSIPHLIPTAGPGTWSMPEMVAPE